jgi:hypothetical protein
LNFVEQVPEQMMEQTPEQTPEHFALALNLNLLHQESPHRESQHQDKQNLDSHFPQSARRSFLDSPPQPRSDLSARVTAAGRAD